MYRRLQERRQWRSHQKKNSGGLHGRQQNQENGEIEGTSTQPNEAFSIPMEKLNGLGETPGMHNNYQVINAGNADSGGPTHELGPASKDPLLEGNGPSPNPNSANSSSGLNLDMGSQTPASRHLGHDQDMGLSDNQEGRVKKRKKGDAKNDKKALKPSGRNMKKAADLGPLHRARKKKMTFDVKKAGSRKGKRAINPESLEIEVNGWENEELRNEDGDNEWAKTIREDKDAELHSETNVEEVNIVKETLEVEVIGKELGINLEGMSDKLESLIREQETTHGDQ